MATTTEPTRNAQRPIVLRWDDVNDEQQFVVIDDLMHGRHGVLHMLGVAERDAARGETGIRRAGHADAAATALRAAAERFAAVRRLGHFDQHVALRIEVLAAKLGMMVVS
jgi:hypothetical protein